MPISPKTTLWILRLTFAVCLLINVGAAVDIILTARGRYAYLYGSALLLKWPLAMAGASVWSRRRLRRRVAWAEEYSATANPNGAATLAAVSGDSVPPGTSTREAPNDPDRYRPKL